jgi:xylitol oxidase
MAYVDANNISAGANWAESHRYQAQTLQQPSTPGEVQELVLAGGPVRALGSRHSFTDLADTTGRLISLQRLELDLVIDEDARTASFSAGARYGELGTALQARGWALHNTASLPHISVAGAVATATHGSGDRNGNLATAVAAIEFIDGTGELVRLSRGDADFDGAVVGVGSLGIVTRMTLDIQPTFDVRQDLYDNLSWDVAIANFDAITSSAYSVSLFTPWVGDTFPISWLKSRMDAPVPPDTLFGAPKQVSDEHMLPDQPATNTTAQGGIPGPWNERLPHFRLEFTPSNGDELQTEYLLPRENALQAIAAMRELGPKIAPLILISEIRTMTADQLWLSGAYGRDTVALHFTWKKLQAEVDALLPELEERLLPLGGRPHWGKVYAANAAAVAPLYPRFDDFRALAEKYDPNHVFRNAWTARKLDL